MSIRLVIADDAAFIREILAQIVKREGFEVVGEAADGQEAVNVVLREKPDVVFMDIIMPVKSGIEAAKEILAKQPHIKIIACSTEGQETVLCKALEAGCCDFVQKPFKMEQVINVIRQTAGQGGAKDG